MSDNKAKRLGQHWLNDLEILQTIVNSGSVEPGDFVLEIGPGSGSLTRILLEAGAKVTAVEVDEDLASRLKMLINNPQYQLTVVNQDIRRFNLNNMVGNYKLIANIPYYLTSNLIRYICETDNPPSLAVLLVQKEVAERIVAIPGGMSTLSVVAQLYYEVRLGRVVAAELFTPAPKVDSQLLILVRRQQPLFGKGDPKNLLRLVKAGFSNRRKKLRSSIGGGLNISKQHAESLLKKADISPDDRAQNLSIDDWLKLSEVWSCGDYTSS